MFRTSIFLTILFAISTMITPVSAFTSRNSGATNQQVAAHYHPITSVQRSYLHPISKKKPG